MSKKKRQAGPKGKIKKYRGYTLHSTLEYDVIKELYRDRRKHKRAFSFDYESETLDYTIHSTYTPDFILEDKETGKKIYVECKGYLDAPSRRKLLAVRRSHPELDIRLLFEKNNRIRKGSKMRYTDWAERNGFNGWHVGRSIPIDEWLYDIVEEG